MGRRGPRRSLATSETADPLSTRSGRTGQTAGALRLEAAVGNRSKIGLWGVGDKSSMRKAFTDTSPSTYLLACEVDKLVQRNDEVDEPTEKQRWTSTVL